MVNLYTHLCWIIRFMTHELCYKNSLYVLSEIIFDEGKCHVYKFILQLIALHSVCIMGY